jgi:MFS family permease
MALSLFHAINDGSLAVFLAAIPVMRIDLGLSFVEIGTVLSTGLLATVAMQFVSGHLSDKGLTRRILVLGFASIAIVDLILAGADNYWQVLLFYLLLRTAAGVYHPVSFSTIFSTLSDRSEAMGFQSAFGDSSLAFAMVTTGFVAESFGWRVPFLAWGIAGILGVLVFLSLTPPPSRSAVAGTIAENTNGGRSLGFTRGYVVLQFSNACLQCFYLIYTGFMPLFLNVNLNLSPGMSSLIVALWLAVGVGATFNAGRFVRIFRGERRTLRITFSITSIIMVAATVLMIGAGLWLPAVVLLVLSGIPFFLTYPVIYGVIGTTAPRRHLGLAYATNLSFALVAGSFLSYVAGYLSSIYSLVIILPILVISVLGATLTAFLLR